jgi:hypothetical protein
MPARVPLCLLAFLILSAPDAYSDSISLTADRDNTLYENGNGELSNGHGPTMFCGRTNQLVDDKRRALVHFDLSPIPSGSVITSVHLRLTMTQTIAGTQTVGVHRVLADWGEGSSNAGDPGGPGAPSEPGDATWIHRFYSSVPWGAPGGDFDPSPSASGSVGGVGSYTWGSTNELVADVQSWLDNPGSNFGWIIVGNESTFPTAKRFNTREHVTATTWPTLILNFDPPVIPVEATTWSGIKALYESVRIE